jgi:hypothetical protein
MDSFGENFSHFKIEKTGKYISLVALFLSLLSRDVSLFIT